MRQTGRKLKIPTTPSSGLTLRCNAQNSGRCFTYFYWFVIKDVTQEQAEGRDALRKAWGGQWGGTGPPTPSSGVPPPGTMMGSST